jgi:serine/threonine protein kinase/Tol biopolymer transport system component
MIGQTLDRYRIESKLGQGGMGVVYKARDTHLQRFVAVKVLPPESVSDPVRRERFIREARAASALNHPGIVTVHDIRTVDGIDLIVMEHLEGMTLDEAIPRNGMRGETVLQLAVQMADALARAHEAGILHRDIKPSNVIVSAEGRAKILDFGLAKLTDRNEASPDDATLPAELTTEGAVVGTTTYMSPEQAEGKKVDARSDIFSFGAVLYTMVTGQKPFTGPSRVAILNRILHEDPTPPRQLDPSISPELEKTILRCLRKDPARRYQSMADLKVALEDLEVESPAATVPVAVPPRSRATVVWMVALTIPLLAAAAFFGWRAWRARASTEPLQAVPLTTFAGVERYPTLSPEGDQVAFTWNGPKRDNTDVYVQRIGAGSPALRLTTDARSDTNPVWSPDGRWIAFLRGDSAGPGSQSVRELRLIAPLGGPERKLADLRVREVTDFTPVYLTWCPDSTCLLVSCVETGTAPAIHALSLQTGEKTQITQPGEGVLGDVSPAISPDGRSLVFHRLLSHGFGELQLLPLGSNFRPSGAPRRLTVRFMFADYPAWLPDNEHILFSAKGGLWKLAVFENDPAERVPYVGDDGAAPVVSRPRADGTVRLVYARSFFDDNIWRVDTPAAGAAATGPPVLAIASTRYDIHSQVSPDGRRVAFASTRSGEWQIWTADPDGGNAVQVTSMQAWATGGPRWSHDGKQIAFGSDQEGSFDLYVVPAEGGKPRRLTSHPAFDQGAYFSRDGQWIYFVSERGGRFEIWKMRPTGEDPVQVTNTGGWLSMESVDRGSLYYVENPIENAALWHMPLATGKATPILKGVVWWNFDVGEKGIYYIDRAPDGAARLQFFDLATRQSTTTARDLGDVRCCVTATADGRTIYYVRQDSSVDDLMLVENFR